MYQPPDDLAQGLTHNGLVWISSLQTHTEFMNAGFLEFSASFEYNCHYCIQ